MTPNALLILLIFLSVDAIALLVLLIFHIKKELRHQKIRHYGDRAEEIVKEYVQREFPGAVLINNLFLKTEHATTQLDHVLLCKWGVFVLETKSHNGKINTEGREWVQIHGEKVVRFHSPLIQNETHRKALVRVLQKSRRFRTLPVTGLVIFTSRRVSFSKKQEGVLRLSELAPYVKSGGQYQIKKRGPITAKPGGTYLSKEKIEALEKLIRRSRVRSRSRKRDHEKKVRRFYRDI